MAPLPLRQAGTIKSFNAVFYDKDGSEISQEAIWNVAVIDEHKKYFSIVNEGSTIKSKPTTMRVSLAQRLKLNYVTRLKIVLPNFM